MHGKLAGYFAVDIAVAVVRKQAEPLVDIEDLAGHNRSGDQFVVPGHRILPGVAWRRAAKSTSSSEFLDPGPGDPIAGNVAGVRTHGSGGD